MLSFLTTQYAGIGGVIKMCVEIFLLNNLIRGHHTYFHSTKSRRSFYFISTWVYLSQWLRATDLSASFYNTYCGTAGRENSSSAQGRIIEQSLSRYRADGGRAAIRTCLPQRHRSNIPRKAVFESWAILSDDSTVAHRNWLSFHASHSSAALRGRSLWPECAADFLGEFFTSSRFIWVLLSYITLTIRWHKNARWFSRCGAMIIHFGDKAQIFLGYNMSRTIGQIHRGRLRREILTKNGGKGKIYGSCSKPKD